jgi:hypothetical protein
MEPDRFFNKILTKIIGQREYYPIISRGGNSYNGNYSLIMKAIKIAYEKGHKEGVRKTEAGMFNEYALQN